MSTLTFRQPRLVALILMVLIAAGASALFARAGFEGRQLAFQVLISGLLPWVTWVGGSAFAYMTGASFFRGKVRFDFDGSYNANPGSGGTNFPDRRWRLQYATQCCTIVLERLVRKFVAADDREDIFLRVDLTGVGKVLSHTF